MEAEGKTSDSFFTNFVHTMMFAHSVLPFDPSRAHITTCTYYDVRIIVRASPRRLILRLGMSKCYCELQRAQSRRPRADTHEALDAL